METLDYVSDNVSDEAEQVDSALPSPDFLNQIASSYAENAHVLRAQLLQNGFSPMESDDIVHESYIKALDRWERYDPSKAKLATWISRIATTTALDHLPREKGKKENLQDSLEPHMAQGFDIPDPYSDDPEAVVIRHETRIKQVQAVSELIDAANLSRQEQIILGMHYDGLKYSEIAEVLGMTRSRVVVTVSAAQKKLEEHSDPNSLATSREDLLANPPSKKDLLRYRRRPTASNGTVVSGSRGIHMGMYLRDDMGR